MSHPLVSIAREAIRRHLVGEEFNPRSGTPAPLPWGVFVSLHGPSDGVGEGPLRGCIGSLDLQDTSIETEVARVAVSSAMADPRFDPLRSHEIDGLSISVYLLDPPERVDDVDALDPARFGVIVTGRRRQRGLLLPAIPGIDSPETQLAMATQKAGLRPDAEIIIERFTAQIHH